jgi:hypothetical protein
VGDDVRQSPDHLAFTFGEFRVGEHRERHSKQVVRVVGAVVVDVCDQPLGECDLVFSLHTPRVAHETFVV